MADRLDKLGAVTAAALRAMRQADAAERDKHSQALAAIWQRELGSTELAFLFATGAKVVSSDVLAQFAEWMTSDDGKQQREE